MQAIEAEKKFAIGELEHRFGEYCFGMRKKWFRAEWRRNSYEQKS
jgi:hypothetical protein